MKRGILFILILLSIPNVYAVNISEVWESVITGWQIINPPVQIQESDQETTDPLKCTSIDTCSNKLKELIQNQKKLQEFYEKVDKKLLKEAVIKADSNIKSKFTIGKNSQGEEIIILYPSCEDNTPQGECSINTPYACNSGTLEEDCEKCGAKIGYLCKKVNFFNSTNKTTLIKKEIVKALDCKEASGICDTSCSESFREVSFLSGTCNTLDIESLTGREQLSQIQKSPLSQKCCVPIVKVRNFTNVLLTNLTTNRTSVHEKATENLCIEKTEFNQCTKTDPLYCTEYGLFNFCSQCGCPNGEVCNFVTNACVKATKEKSLEVFKEFVRLSPEESSLLNNFLTPIYKTTKEEVDVKEGPIRVDIEQSPDNKQIIIVNINEDIMSLRVEEGKPQINFDFRESN